MFLSVLFTCMQRFKHVAQVHSEIRKCEKMSILHAMWHLKVHYCLQKPFSRHNNICTCTGNNTNEGRTSQQDIKCLLLQLPVLSKVKPVQNSLKK